VLVGAVSGLSSAWVASDWPGILAAQERAREAAKSGKPAEFGFFSPAQAAEVEAMAAQIIPSDSTPGVREARVIYFIDQALITFARDKQALYTQGLKDLQMKTRELFPAAEGFPPGGASKFSGLDSAQQVQLLKAIEKTEFFTLVRQHTIMGFFSDPKYGGNFNKVGWKLIGFEDKFAFEPPFGYYDRGYRSE
jgi:gluconate 2-dehydrogenase gamma chain